MAMFRDFIIFSLLATGAAAAAQQEVPIAKVGEALKPTVVYTSPNANSRILYRVKEYDKLYVWTSRYAGWKRVLLSNYAYAYTPASAIAELPLTLFRKSRSRGSLLASRGGLTTRVTGNALADMAQQYTGTPYVWGGNDLNAGVDCSGFVKKLAGTIGLDLPRTAAEQALVGMPLYRLEDLQAGDRLYFKERSEARISHTGIYLGYGYFIHSSHGKGGVHTDFLSAGWRKMLVAARR